MEAIGLITAVRDREGDRRNYTHGYYRSDSYIHMQTLRPGLGLYKEIIPGVFTDNVALPLMKCIVLLHVCCGVMF